MSSTREHSAAATSTASYGAVATSDPDAAPAPQSVGIGVIDVPRDPFLLVPKSGLTPAQAASLALTGGYGSGSDANTSAESTPLRAPRRLGGGELPPVTQPNGDPSSVPLLPSLPESHATIDCPSPNDHTTEGRARKCWAFLGPGLLVAVGYMDPGNWAVALSAGAQYGYALLHVILLSNFAAMLLQFLALKLGIACERDLAQACRAYLPARWNLPLWILCEIAITACDLAEVIGSAIALNLLFGLPLWAGVLITGVDVFAILLLEQKSFRLFEVLIGVLTLVIAVCFGYELAVSGVGRGGRHEALDLLYGLLVPQPRRMVSDPDFLFLAIGIIGATVMPHNLYLHSSIVQSRAYPRDTAGKRMAVHYAAIDSTVSLALAFLVNCAILILSSAVFHHTAHAGDVADIREAAKLLSPSVGERAASLLFAIALLASGQNSTLTGTLAGQIVSEGFIEWKFAAPWKRRLLTRALAIVPAVGVALVAGDSAVAQLLLLSQVVLSVQLSFAVVPLVHFTSSAAIMTTAFVNSKTTRYAAWTVAVVIIVLNAVLLIQAVGLAFVRADTATPSA